MENFYKDNDRLKHQLSHPLLREIVALRENNYAESAEYACAPTDFEDAVECYDKAMEVFGEICAETIAVNAPKVDKQGPSCENGRVTYADGTQENHRVLTEASFYGLSLPRKYDGLNFPTVLSIMASEMVARADAGFQNIWSLQDCAETINEFGDEELKAAMLPRISKGATCSMDLTEPDAGSDLQSAMLKATWDEANNTWRLNGVKRFITNGDADIKLVLARSEEGTTDARGLSLYVYDKQWGGVTVRRIEHKLGIKGSPTCELVFDNAPAKLIGNRRMGLIKYVMSLMNGARLGIGAQSVGISEAALQAAKRYASERKQFGKAIIELAPVYEMIGVMQAKLDAGTRTALRDFALRGLLESLHRNIEGSQPRTRGAPEIQGRTEKRRHAHPDSQIDEQRIQQPDNLRRNTGIRRFGRGSGLPGRALLSRCPCNKHIRRNIAVAGDCCR